MHITPEAFSALLSGKNDHKRITQLDEQTWKELWEDFLDEARRYGDREKLNIIGNVEWEFKVPEIEHKDKLTGEDKKLIGEFIRKHHPRIAHEIAINGFPSNAHHLPFASDLKFDLRNLAGLLARSHGIAIRSSFAYLQFLYQDTWTKPFNIELIYLMVVLRIADYFQIDASRTPDVIVKLKTFNSPISEIEHFKHLDIDFIQEYKNDPETLMIQASPRNSTIFVKLQELFTDIQRELDISWAIIGEVYGKEAKEKQPEITYRRVKSNIDNASEYSTRVNYIPEKIKFNVSSELPKLLISPLYGNDPTFGIRELLQNAVDSCREREFLEGSEYIGKVVISFFEAKGQLYFQIEDNGLGMTLNVIKQYFLEVGSSLRKSALWKKEFLDETGKSKVQRSGKFGIGVLAAYLIGEKIILHTRDSSSQTGLFFETNLNTEQIEVIKKDKEQVGTTIIVPINQELINRLKKSEIRFDKWYFHASPQVKYDDQLDEFYNLGYEKYSPGINDNLPDYWNELKDSNFNKVIWTYGKNIRSSSDRFATSGNLTCNGILIPEGIRRSTYEYANGVSLKHIALPDISIFDFDGRLSLSLSRNNIDGELPFQDKLVTEIYKDLIAKLLVSELNSPMNGNLLSLNKELSFFHPAVGEIDILYSNSGFILRTQYFKEKNQDRTWLKLSIKKEGNYPINLDCKDTFVSIINDGELSMTNYYYTMNLGDLESGGKLFLGKSMYDKLFDERMTRYPKPVKRDHKLINSSENFVEINYKHGQNIYNLDEIQDHLSYCNYILESSVREIVRGELNTSEHILNEQLEIYLGGMNIIPYDIEERKAKFKRAFRELKDYLKKYTN
jgi:hypothetical protein